MGGCGQALHQRKSFQLYFHLIIDFFNNFNVVCVEEPLFET